MTAGLYTSSGFGAPGDTTYSLQVELIGVSMTAGSVRAYIDWRSSAGVILDTTRLEVTAAASISNDWVLRKVESYVTPTGTTYATITLDVTSASFGPNGFVGWRRLKLERGATCSLWTDDRSASDLAARAAETETVTADLAANKADASRVFTLEAQVNTSGTGILARLSAAEVATSTGLSAAASRLTELEARFDTPSTGVLARLGTAENAISTNNAASVSRLNVLEASVNTPGTGLLARASTLESTTSDLAANKADASRVTALESQLTTPTTGVLARLSSVENTSSTGLAGSVSRLNALEATVDAPGTGVTARLGAAELAIATNNSASVSRLNSLEATVYTSGTGLTSRLGTLESAVASNNAAAASRLTVLEARDITRSNLIRGLADGPAGFDYVAGFTFDGYGPGPRIYADAGTLAAVTKRFEANGATTYTAGASVIDQRNTNRVFMQFEWRNSSDASPTYSPVSSTIDVFGRMVLTATSPASSGYGRVIYATSGNGNGFASLLDLTAVAGSTDVPNASPMAALSQAGARLAVVESAAFDLAANKADASRVSSLEATVNTVGTGVTARLTTVESVAASANGTAKAIVGNILDVNGYVSGTASVNNGVTSSFEVLASVFGIRDPSSGERTEYRSGNWYVYSPTESTRTRYGKAFGGSQKLVWWTGPSSVAEGSETKANAYVYLSQNTVGGLRFGGTDTPGGGVFTASAPGVRVKTQIGGTGAITTPSVPITVAGNTGTVTYSWSVVFGDIDGITISSATSANPTFSANPAGVARLQAIWAWTATDSGTGVTRAGQTYVTIQRDA